MYSNDWPMGVITTLPSTTLDPRWLRSVISWEIELFVSTAVETKYGPSTVSPAGIV